MENKFVLNNTNYDIKNTKLGIEYKNNEIFLYPEINAKTSAENIDDEVRGFSLYHEDGINTHVTNIEDLKGKKFTWNNEGNKFAEYAGIVYAVENEVITRGEIEILDIKEDIVIIKWSGLANILWNKDFGRNVPFETIFEAKIPTEINKIDTFNIWGRELDIKVIYDCYDNEEVIANQIKAYEEFAKISQIILEEVYKQLKAYCKENYKEQIEEEFDNIFKYIMPKTLYIKRSVEDRIVALLCNFKFDTEHGLAVVIKNEEVVNIGNQDIIL